MTRLGKCQLRAESILPILRFGIAFLVIHQFIGASQRSATANAIVHWRPSASEAEEQKPQINHLSPMDEVESRPSNNSSSGRPHHKLRRHRRRLPMGLIGKLIAKLTGKSGKAAAASAAAAAGKADDVVVGARRAGQIGRAGSPLRGGGAGRSSLQQHYRGVDPPPFNPYTLPRDEAIRKARQKALTGANVALATGGIAAGIWYFSGENTALFIAIIVGVVLVALTLACSLFLCLYASRKRKKGYYAVNEDLAAAFAKKMLFYLLC